MKNRTLSLILLGAVLTMAVAIGCAGLDQDVLTPEASPTGGDGVNLGQLGEPSPQTSEEDSSTTSTSAEGGILDAPNSATPGAGQEESPKSSAGEGVPSPAEKRAMEVVEAYVKNTPTYQYDGIDRSLQLVEINPSSECATCIELTYVFQSRHGGYGDRTGKFITQVITDHTVVVTVNSAQVTTAVMDSRWDMIAQQTTDSQ